MEIMHRVNIALLTDRHLHVRWELRKTLVLTMLGSLLLVDRRVLLTSRPGILNFLALISHFRI